jgi:hypothetical protein
LGTPPKEGNFSDLPSSGGVPGRWGGFFIIVNFTVLNLKSKVHAIRYALAPIEGKILFLGYFSEPKKRLE